MAKSKTLKSFLEKFILTLDKLKLYAIISVMKDIERQLKRALINSAVSRRQVALKAGLSEAQLSYFVNGKRTLTLRTAAKLARTLGLELTERKKGR